jgi:hypothetical protein
MSPKYMKPPRKILSTIQGSGTVTKWTVRGGELTVAEYPEGISPCVFDMMSRVADICCQSSPNDNPLFWGKECGLLREIRQEKVPCDGYHAGQKAL